MEMKNQFGDFSSEYTDEEKSKIVILPVPFDGTSTYVKGSDKGPSALIDASYNLEFYDIETDSEVYKEGIYTAFPVEGHDKPEDVARDVKAMVKQFLEKKKFPVILGGEHSVTIGSVQAFHEKYPDLSVLQLDAHTDLRDSYFGSQYNHACVMARVKELCPFVQVGIRSMDVEEKPFLPLGKVFFAEQIYQDDKWMDKAVDQLTETVYITVDLDVFDPSVLPSTGTPEPGGMQWYQLLRFVKKVFERKNVVGFDIVELCPNEKEKSSDFLAAKLLYKMLSYKYCMR